jgi:hypothetical protein
MVCPLVKILVCHISSLSKERKISEVYNINPLKPKRVKLKHRNGGATWVWIVYVKISNGQSELYKFWLNVSELRLYKSMDALVPKEESPNLIQFPIFTDCIWGHALTGYRITNWFKPNRRSTSRLFTMHLPQSIKWWKSSWPCIVPEIDLGWSRYCWVLHFTPRSLIALS